jgi:hypothetical protein
MVNGNGLRQKSSFTITIGKKFKNAGYSSQVNTTQNLELRRNLPYCLFLLTLVIKHYELWWRAISIPGFYKREVIFVPFEEANDFRIKHQLSHAYFNNCTREYKLQNQAPDDIIK